MLTLLLLGVSLSREAQAFYNPSTGRWLSRDPVEEGGGNNLYVCAANNTVDFYDLWGLRWTVARNGDETAIAEPDEGDTLADLANLIGLQADEFPMWLTVASGNTMPASAAQKMTGCEHFEIPNTVVAYWAGWDHSIGKHYVQWNSSVKYLRRLGFKVDAFDHQDGDAMALTKILVAESFSRRLHGLYFWGHGYAPYPSIGLVSQSGDPLLFYNNPGLFYRMALGIVFACDSNSGESALMSGNGSQIWHGFTDTLYPLPGMKYNVDNFIKHGQQATH